MLTDARQAHSHRWLRVSPLLVGIALSAALVALGAFVLVERSGGRSQDEALVDQVFSAINARDGEAVGRLFTKDAVVAWAPNSPMNIVGLQKLRAAARAGVPPETPVGEPTTLLDPPTGFSRLDAAVSEHYVVQPVLIHHDPFVVIFDVRGGKIATMIMVEPFDPIRTVTP